MPTFDDAALLAEAIALAAGNADRGQLPFGAIVAREGAVMATGVNTAFADDDSTAHAEIAAVRAACRNVRALHLERATLVSSCEPCAMCYAAALIAGVDRIIYAAPKELVPDLGVPFPSAVAEMQAVWRRVGSDPMEHIPTEACEEPFARFLNPTRGPSG